MECGEQFVMMDGVAMMPGSSASMYMYILKYSSFASIFVEKIDYNGIAHLDMPIINGIACFYSTACSTSQTTYVQSQLGLLSLVKAPVLCGSPTFAALIMTHIWISAVLTHKTSIPVSTMRMQLSSVKVVCNENPYNYTFQQRIAISAYLPPTFTI